MTRLRVLFAKFTGLFRKAQLEQQLDDDVGVHLEMLTEENLRKGIDPEEARYAALRQFGNVSSMKEECRETWSVRIIEELVQDLRYGLRQLRRNPGFTVVAVLTLALGIGANTAIFSILNGLLLRQLPVPLPQQVVRFSSASFSYPDYIDFRGQDRSFEGICADYELPVMANLNSTRPPQRVMGTLVTANFFSTLGVRFSLGRGFLPREGQISDPSPVIILSRHLWLLRFGGDREIIGKTVHLNNEPYTVVGITPREFQGVYPGLRPDFWAPMPLMGQFAPFEQRVSHPFTNRDEHGFDILGRIKPGISRQEALSEVNLVYSRIRKAADKKGKAFISFENPARLPGEISQFAMGVTTVLMGIAGIVLLIACVNVMNLLLARATVHRKEFAVRLAVGASRLRLVRQVMTSNLLLAVPAAALGLLLAMYAMAEVSHLQLPLPVPLSMSFAPDMRVLALTAFVAVAATLIFGLAPAFKVTRPDVATFLKDGDSGSGSLRGRRLRSSLVVLQVGASIIALVVASLFLHSLNNAYAVNLGFNPKNLLVMRMDPVLQGYPNKKCERFFRQLHQQVAEDPGVLSSSTVTPLPLSIISSGRDITSLATHKSVGSVAVLVVGEDYFETMGIHLLRGSAFSDQTSSSPTVAVINKEMAKALFPDQDAIGQLIQGEGFGPKGAEQRTYQIIGVVGDTKSKTVGEQLSPCLYILMDQNPYEMAGFSSFLGSGVSLVVRTAGSPRGMVEPILQQIHNLDPDLPVFGVETMEEQVGKALLIAKVAASLLAVFGFLSLALAGIGLYGVMSYSVSCRTHEIGVRMALGAERRDVLKMVVSHGLRPALIGMIIGLAGALALTRFLSSLLYGVKPNDPITFISVSLILIGVALVACYIPARRASKVDPMVALRYE